jgi:hypothetical protein
MMLADLTKKPQQRTPRRPSRSRARPTKMTVPSPQINEPKILNWHFAKKIYWGSPKILFVIFT